MSMYVYMYVCMYVYIYIYIYTHVHEYIYIYIYTHTHIYTYTQFSYNRIYRYTCCTRPVPGPHRLAPACSTWPGSGVMGQRDYLYKCFALAFRTLLPRKTLEQSACGTKTN